MDEYQELKHRCRFCSKSFPCGRSLGGHMRSHMINSPSELDEKGSRGKLPSPPGPEAANRNGYVLRENPKKTSRFADSKIETSVHGKFCQDCGKGFQSWKALFGHMKCHSGKGKNQSDPGSEEEEEDSEISSNQWGDEAPNPRLGTKTPMAPEASSNNNDSSSVSEIGEEQEQVAMCLMMLSRDVGHWGGLDSVADSSGNSSMFLEDPPWLSTHDGMDQKILGNLCGSLGNPLKMIESKNRYFGFPEIDRTKRPECKSEVSEGARRKNMAWETELDQTGLVHRKRKLQQHDYSTEMGAASRSDDFFKTSERASKYQCATCSRIFNSYQALGGHRASHKKIGGCFASRTQSSRNAIDIGQIFNTAPKNESSIDGSGPLSRKSRGHECPICFRIFLSGQALGGHKRSHFIGGSEQKDDSRSRSTVNHRPVQEASDLLDLNLPAPLEDESNGNDDTEYERRWIGGSRKRESLVSLLSD